MKKIKLLSCKWKTELFPLPPFYFDGTVYNPVHFPTPVEAYKLGFFWQTLRFKGKILGIKFENKGTTLRPKVKLTVFSERPLTKKFQKELVQELNYRFEFNRDISGFMKKFAKDKFLDPVIKRRLGMRSKCGFSLYEMLMIYIVLQNATVRRTVQMIEAMLKKYGTMVRFNGKELFVIWEPERLLRISEEELRKLKVGYRAKFFKKVSQDILSGNFDETRLRRLSNEELKKRLVKLYGIGPHSVENLMWEVFHRDVFSVLPAWERKIYSRLLFGEKLVSERKILNTIVRRWDEYKRFAAFYLWTDLFWRHKQTPIEWLEKEIRL